jgi:hypothetical protein
MPLEDPKELQRELFTQFKQDWGNSPGPQTVDQKTIDQDPYFEQYDQIGKVLTDEQTVTQALMELQARMLKQVGGPAARLTRFIAFLKPPKVQDEAILDYFKGRYAGKEVPEKNRNLSKLLTNALAEVENDYGFKECGDPVTLTGGIDGEVFANELIQKGKRWKDVGVPGTHGEHTHRIQWYIAGRVLGKKTLAVYQHIGKWFWKREGAEPKYLSLWDALFDRAGGTTNPFAPFNDTDLRRPEKLCNWILLPKNKETFPLLRAYLEARFTKRRNPDVFRLEDYLAVKLYGKDLEGLRAEYKVTKDPSKLERIAGETDGMVNLGDGSIEYRPGKKGTKIIERKEFAKKK